MDSIATTAPSSVSWYLWAGVLGITSSFIGGGVGCVPGTGASVEIPSSHPPHILIYLCGVMAAVVCGYLVPLHQLRPCPAAGGAAAADTIGRHPRAACATGSVHRRLGRYRDAYLGTVRQLVARCLRPGCQDHFAAPTTLLILGIRAISLGVLFLILAAMNRAADPTAATRAGKQLRRHNRHTPPRGLQGRCSACCFSWAD